MRQWYVSVIEKLIAHNSGRSRILKSVHLIVKRNKVGECGGMFPQENFRPSEIVSGAV